MTHGTPKAMATIFALLATGPVSAQGEGSFLGDNRDAAAGSGNGVSTVEGTSEITGGGITYGELLSELRTNADAGMAPEADFASADDTTTVITVPLSELRSMSGSEGPGLDEAIAAQGSGIADVREAIRANAILNETLDSRGHRPEQVVAYETNGMGDVILVVDDTE